MKRITSFLLCLVVFSCSIPLFGQSISGKVLSARDSLPISGATILVEDVNAKLIKQDVSGSDGAFSLDVGKQEQINLTISFVGFISEQIQVKGFSKNINVGKVFLEENNQMLGEVVVAADNRIHKVDKSIIYPSEIQREVSNSSLALLQNLNLPGLYVDAIEQKVNINGAQPIYMINGIVKTLHDLNAINPKNIARIEYEDSPSIRHMDKNAGGVINVILKTKENGGNFWGNVLGSPMTGFINTDLYFAYNWSKSELSINYFNNWRDYTQRWTDKTEQYISPEYEFYRNFDGVHSPFGYLNQGIYLNYTYQPNSSTMFSATFRNDLGKQHTSVNGDMTESHKDLSYFRESESKFDSYIPALDLYFKRMIKNGQSLEVNMVGTYQNTDYHRTLKDYSEIYHQEIANTIDNSKISLISEVNYIKSFENVRLNLGYQNKISSLSNKYNKESTEENLSENNNYLYVGASGKLKKFSYNLGTGIKLFAVKKDTGKKYIKNHSNLSVMYSANDNLNVRLSSFYTPYLPTLSQLSNVTQVYDEIMKIKGNPNLKAAHVIGTKLFVNYDKKNFSSTLTLGYQHRANTIYMDVQPLDGTCFISQTQNAIGDNHFNIEYKWSYSELFNHVNLYSTIGYNSYMSKGVGYRHHLDNFYWDLSAQVYWKKWTLSAYYVKPKKTLLAQTIDLGENNSQISLGYNLRNLELFAAVKYPFEKNGWEWSEENLSKVNPSKTSVCIKDNKLMLLLGVTYSFRFGKGLQKLNKNLDNNDKVSILKVQE